MFVLGPTHSDVDKSPADPVTLGAHGLKGPPDLRTTRVCFGRSQWPRGLRRRSAATRLLRLQVRIPPVAWMSVCCECCVLLGRGLCVGLITRVEESYRLRCVVECGLETS